MRQISLRDDNYRRLFGYAESFDDTADDVVERLLDSVERADHPPAIDSRPLSPVQRRGTRAAPGSILPEREYWPAILDTLIENGGQAHANDVIDEVGRRLDSRLLPKDREELAIGEVRWRNRVRFARLRMKEANLLSDDSPRGIWAITDLGRKYVK